jgi:hypothetical protein
VLWRLRYKLALRDLPEMFLIRGIVFSHEAVRDSETKLTPALKRSVSARSMTTNSMPHSTGFCRARLPSRLRWPSATSKAARWYSTMSRRATWREAAVRWLNVDTAVMARRARSRSSTACSASPTVAPSRAIYKQVLTVEHFEVAAAVAVRPEDAVKANLARAERGSNVAVGQAADDADGVMLGGNDGAPLSTPRRPST